MSPLPVPPRLSQYLWLLVVLHGHGDDVEADDAGDEQIQVVAGAHLVDQEAESGVIRVVGLTLSFCSGEESDRQIKGFLCVFLKPKHPHSPTPGMRNSRPIAATCCLFYFPFFLAGMLPFLIHSRAPVILHPLNLFSGTCSILSLVASGMRWAGTSVLLKIILFCRKI